MNCTKCEVELSEENLGCDGGTTCKECHGSEKKEECCGGEEKGCGCNCNCGE